MGAVEFFEFPRSPCTGASRSMRPLAPQIQRGFVEIREEAWRERSKELKSLFVGASKWFKCIF